MGLRAGECLIRSAVQLSSCPERLVGRVTGRERSTSRPEDSGACRLQGCACRAIGELPCGFAGERGHQQGGEHTQPLGRGVGEGEGRAREGEGGIVNQCLS